MKRVQEPAPNSGSGSDVTLAHSGFTHTYRATCLTSSGGTANDEEKLFEFAISVDRVARELIRHALSVAAERSVEYAGFQRQARRFWPFRKFHRARVYHH